MRRPRRGEADAILRDVEASGVPPIEAVPLPPVCTEDWFLAEWRREDQAWPRGCAKK